MEEKICNIYIQLTHNVASFKIRPPFEWLEKLGINKENTEVNLSYKDGIIELRKSNGVLPFASLPKQEKVLQVKKYFELNGDNHLKTKDLMAELEQYFKVSYRTLYRYSKEDVTEDELKGVKLLPRQDENERNINVIIRNTTVTLTIPTNLAVLLLKEKNYNDLNITSATQIYQENTKVSIKLILDGDKIIFKKLEGEELAKVERMKEYEMKFKELKSELRIK